MPTPSTTVRLRRAAIRLAVVTAACFTSLASQALRAADDAPSTESADRAEYLIRGMLHERERLVTGVARFQGRKLERSDSTTPIEGDIKGTCAFDHQRGWSRYDEQEPRFVRGLSSETLKGRPFNAETLKAMEAEVPAVYFNQRIEFIRNSEYTTWWARSTPDAGSGSLVLRPPDVPPSGHEGNFHFHDVRAWGLMDYSDFTLGKDTLAELCNRWLSCIAKGDCSVVNVSEASGLTTMALEQQWLTASLTIDVKHGFTPLEYIAKGRHDDTTVNTSRVKWQEVSGVWVPQSCVIESDIPHIEHSYARYSLDYDWDLVNQPVPAHYFDYKTFTGIPAEWSVHVMDIRGKEPVCVGRWLGNGKIGPYDLDLGTGHRPSRGLSRTTVALIALGAAVLIAIAIWLVRSKGFSASG